MNDGMVPRKGAGGCPSVSVPRTAITERRLMTHLDYVNVQSSKINVKLNLRSHIQFFIYFDEYIIKDA